MRGNEERGKGNEGKIGEMRGRNLGCIKRGNRGSIGE